MLICSFVWLFERGFLCLGCPGTLSVSQAGLEFRDLPVSASQGLKLKKYAITTQLIFKVCHYHPANLYYLIIIIYFPCAKVGMQRSKNTLCGSVFFFHCLVLGTEIRLSVLVPDAFTC